MSQADAPETFFHDCQRCGACCEGLRVQVRPDRHAELEANAARLGIPAPFDGGFLRHADGRCVFFAVGTGCQLHASFGADAKPEMCVQFPFVYTGPDVGIDPSCFHAEPAPRGSAPVRMVPAFFETPPDTTPLPWADLSCGAVMRNAMHALLPGAWTAGVGAQAAQHLVVLLESEPRIPDPMVFESRVRTALRFGLVPFPDPVVAVVGGAQLVAGAGLPPGAGFAAWMRLLRLGLL